MAWLAEAEDGGGDGVYEGIRYNWSSRDVPAWVYCRRSGSKLEKTWIGETIDGRKVLTF